MLLKEILKNKNTEKGSYSLPPSEGGSAHRLAPGDGHAGQHQPPPHRRQLSYQHHCLCYQGPIQFIVYLEIFQSWSMSTLM